MMPILFAQFRSKSSLLILVLPANAAAAGFTVQLFVTRSFSPSLKALSIFLSFFPLIFCCYHVHQAITDNAGEDDMVGRLNGHKLSAEAQNNHFHLVGLTPDV